MSQRLAARTIVPAAAALMLALSATALAAPSAEAKDSKPLFPCPKKVGSAKLEGVVVSPQHHAQTCQYALIKKQRRRGSASLHLTATPDKPGERHRCVSREPQVERIRDDDPRALKLSGAERNVYATVSWTEGLISQEQAARSLRKMIAASGTLGHPCVPPVEPRQPEGIECPLRLPGDLVRADWHSSSDEPRIEQWLGYDDEYVLRCRYDGAYGDEPDAGRVRISWAEGGPSNTRLCMPEDERRSLSAQWKTGHRPIEIEISTTFLDNWPGQAEAMTDALARSAAARSWRCPDTPDGPAPYETASDAVGARTTTIMLSGGPGEEPPAVGTTIDLAEDDQFEVVVGGAGGKVIREGFIGDRGTISGYGARISDADGNWVVLVTVDVGTGSDATPTDPRATAGGPSPADPVTEDPASGDPGTADPATDDFSIGDPAIGDQPASDDPPVAEPVAEPVEHPVPEPTEQPGDGLPDATGPEPEPPADADAPAARAPQADLSGLPEEVAALAKDLPPDGIDALRGILLRVSALGEMLDESGQGGVTIPASEIASLRALAPDVADEVRTGAGSVFVETWLGEVIVTPVIGLDGLVEVKLSRFTFLQTNEVVRALVASLNTYVAERGGRFQTISVTPEGLTVTASG